MTAGSSSTDHSNDQELPLIAHLKELRNRLLYCFIAVIAVFLGLVYFANDIYSVVSAPMMRALPEGSKMIAYEVASPFLAPFKLTFYVSFFIAMPFVLYQIWSFIAPALYQKEKRIAIPLFISSVILFYAGMAFAYFVVFEIIFKFFASVVPSDIQQAPDINAYLSFVLKLFFAFGFAFEIPIATVLLVWAGAVDTTKLSNARPYIIIGCFVFAMLLTPPDVISQTLLALPMWLLFEVGVFFGRWIERDKKDEEESPAT
ncbi:twin-arginine translocase subunit TatC [Aurantivibrio plasticivorans]